MLVLHNSHTLAVHIFLLLLFFCCCCWCLRKPTSIARPMGTYGERKDVYTKLNLTAIKLEQRQSEQQQQKKMDIVFMCSHYGFCCCALFGVCVFFSLFLLFSLLFFSCCWHFDRCRTIVERCKIALAGILVPIFRELYQLPTIHRRTECRH